MTDRMFVRAVFWRLTAGLLVEQQQPPENANDNPFPLLAPEEIYRIGEEERAKALATQARSSGDGFKDFLQQERLRGDAYDHDHDGATDPAIGDAAEAERR